MQTTEQTTEYAAVPDTRALESLERDLRFHPADPAAARTLSAAQVGSFNEHGYLKNLRVFPPDEIAAVRDYFDGLLAEYLAAGKTSYSISTAHLKHGGVWDLLTDCRVVDLAADLLGDDVVGWGSHFFCKMPRDGKAVAWHQDASFWPLSPSKAVTVWLAIDDADAENGCMKFVGGSHHVGHLTYRESTPEDHSVLNQTIEDPEQYGPVVLDELQAGECSLHSDLLLHGSEANDSDRRRCGLTLRYAAAEVRAGMEWNGKGVHVRGEDASGHWANAPRPERE